MSLMLLFQSILLSTKIIYKSYYNLFWAKNVVVLLLYFCITLYLGFTILVISSMF